MNQTKKTGGGIRGVIMLLIAFVAGFLVVSLLSGKSKTATDTSPTQNATISQPTTTDDAQLAKYISGELVPLLQKGYPSCQKISNYEWLLGCISSKKFDYQQTPKEFEALVNQQYKKYIMPKFWQKVYTNQPYLKVLKSKDEYALEGKKQAIKSLIQKQIITSAQWCADIPETEVKNYCLELLK